MLEAFFATSHADLLSRRIVDHTSDRQPPGTIPPRQRESLLCLVLDGYCRLYVFPNAYTLAKRNRLTPCEEESSQRGSYSISMVTSCRDNNGTRFIEHESQDSQWSVGTLDSFFPLHSIKRRQECNIAVKKNTGVVRQRSSTSLCVRHEEG